MTFTKVCKTLQPKALMNEFNQRDNFSFKMNPGSMPCEWPSRPCKTLQPEALKKDFGGCAKIYLFPNLRKTASEMCPQIRLEGRIRKLQLSREEEF
ncbi:hypothetical protein AVEN_81332-1 [Araneus ventricosus]|uniref:Uncharacterized protein n=1 Tax=Araneus ventricosus TaxID=182803 RepID=A0A4Y2B9G7_ARAVE|nr:hypothetical protein AVEN_81332-1 [Araneus ventricosus]